MNANEIQGRLGFLVGAEGLIENKNCLDKVKSPGKVGLSKAAFEFHELYEDLG